MPKKVTISTSRELIDILCRGNKVKTLTVGKPNFWIYDNYSCQIVHIDSRGKRDLVPLITDLKELVSALFTVASYSPLSTGEKLLYGYET